MEYGVRRLGAMTAGWILGLAAMAVGGTAFGAGASWSDSAEELLTVSGTSSFVRRSTLIPQYCPGEPAQNTGANGCLKSRPYWALAIDARGMRYELDQVFAEGSESEPEAIEVGGVSVRSGVRISVTASVSRVSRGFAMLSDVREVVILDRGALDAMAVSRGSPFYGWTCKSVGESQPVYVDIFSTSREGGFAMTVQSIGLGESEPRTVASFEDVEFEMSGSLVRFIGSDRKLQVDLQIDSEEGAIGERESLLKVTTRAPSREGVGIDSPVESSVPLVCGRTR
jgi:hypothetical protein